MSRRPLCLSGPSSTSWNPLWRALVTRPVPHCSFQRPSFDSPLAGCRPGGLNTGALITGSAGSPRLGASPTAPPVRGAPAPVLPADTHWELSEEGPNFVPLLVSAVQPSDCRVEPAQAVPVGRREPCPRRHRPAPPPDVNAAGPPHVLRVSTFCPPACPLHIAHPAATRARPARGGHQRRPSQGPSDISVYISRKGQLAPREAAYLSASAFYSEQASKRYRPSGMKRE